ncbi:hypothetical protein WNY63_05400 [Pseudoalteromonas neustonica]|uniref:Response regulator n=1 Tax=Pseudoalteromonas neustonica TaxID=1840331 RepID=A0ABU9TZG4_9GAMM
MKFDPFVAQIIIATDFNHFTTCDVRTSYLTLKNDSLLKPVDARRRIYAELLKLVKKGWLTKVKPSGKGFTRFIKTTKFDENVLREICEPTISTTELIDKKKSLVDKLNHYKTELLLNLGESEAYKELYTEFPELGNDIQPHYNKARDNNTRILGKIKAIECLLNQN